MELKFNNINPCLLLDKIIEVGIKAEDVIVKNDSKKGESIAENITVTCKEEDAEAITNISENLDSTEIQEEQTTEDYLMDMDYRISKLELGLEE